MYGTLDPVEFIIGDGDRDEFSKSELILLPLFIDSEAAHRCEHRVPFGQFHEVQVVP